MTSSIRRSPSEHESERSGLGALSDRGARLSTRLRSAVVAATSVLLFAAASVVGWTTLREPPDRRGPRAPRPTMSVDGIPLTGDRGAGIVMVAFSDFECDSCVRFAREIWPEVKRRWVDTGQIQFGFRHLPPADQRATAATVAAVCAERQDRFWAMHDFLFANAPVREGADLRSYLPAAGITREPFEACLREGRHDRIDADLEVAARLNLEKAPMFLMGRLESDRRVTVVGTLYGAVPMPQFEKVIALLEGRQATEEK